MIRNVVFDFGGVLVRWKPREIVDRCCGDPESRERLHRLVFQHRDWIELDRGSLDEQEAVRRFAARTMRPQQEMQALLEAVRESLTPIEESFALVRDLSRRGVRLYGLSNMSAPTFAYLRRRYDHWHLFEGIVISGEVKLVKPDPAIFAHLCRVHSIEPRESVFIDDHRPNIEAAQRIGFLTVHFRDAEQCGRELALRREL